MRSRLLLTAIFTSVITMAYAQINEVSGEVGAKSDIVKVIVYSDRAIVERKVVLDLGEGEKRIVFDNLPERTESTSLQARGEGRAIIQDIVYTTKYFSVYPDNKIQALVDAKADKDLSIQARKDKIDRANSEKRVLDKIITKVTAEQKDQASELDPAKWAQIMKFYGDKLVALDDIIRSAENEIRGFKLESDKIGLELGQLQAGGQMKKNQAIVVVSLDAPSKIALTLSYIVYGPTWQPLYDLRVDSESKNINVSYKAQVFQNTGEDWNNVKLALSTARPEIGGHEPELKPWYVSMHNDLGYVQNSKSSEALKPEAHSNSYEADELGALGGNADKTIITTTSATVTKGAIAVMFVISGAKSIASDNTSHKVSIMERTIPASFRYSSVPRLSAYAYLAATMKNETDYPFLPGSTKIFLDGSFIANSSIDLVSPGEEFRTSLGVDEGVKVEYALDKFYKDEQGFFEKSTRYTYKYGIKITNNKKTNIEIAIKDQIPISTDQKIIVKLIDPNYEKDTDSLKKNSQNYLEWLLTVEPAETKTISLSYSVEYPVGMIVNGL